MNNLKFLLLVGIAISTISSSCTTKPAIDVNAQLKAEVVNNYCQIVYASYEDSYNKAVELQTAINTFVASPTQNSFDAAKAAWAAALEPYSQTEVYRYYDGPIDGAGGPETQINGWPMDENYIDYTRNTSGAGTVNTGIIHDLTNYPNITATVLANANEAINEKNISVGYHAIEFLLWGQDHLDVNMNLGQGGNRSYTDYTNVATNYTRRGEYINACAQLLVNQLADIKNAWAPTGSYTTYFKALDPNEAIAKMLTGAGIISKSELAGQRIFVALEVNETDNPQEDELCCFSDNTHRCVINNAKGITNVLTGVYTTTSGQIIGNTSYSVLELLSRISTTKSAELSYANLVATTKVNAIPIPFDKTVTEENVDDNGPTLEAVIALQTQGDEIEIAARILGLSISTALPQ